MSISPLLIPILGITCGIIAIVAGSVIRPWMKLKERQLELQSDKVAEKAAQYAAQTERLEQRMRVLERIITDRGIHVADEIEKLRDDPAPLN